MRGLCRCRLRLSSATNSSRSSLVIMPTGCSRSRTTSAGGSAEEHVERVVDVGAARNRRKGRVHGRADRGLDQCRIAIHAVEQRPLLDRADHARVRVSARLLAVAFQDGQLADAVVLHGVDRRTHAITRLDPDECR